MLHTEVLLDGLYFGEGPRHGPDGRLYLSDFYAHEVLALDLATGARERICQVPGQPSGLGWLPDGRLLVVSMLDRAVWRLESDGRLVRHADLSTVATFHANDMLVDPRGRAYIGNFGFDLHARLAEQGTEALLAPDADPPGAALALVRPDGEVRVVAENLKFPNGTVLLGGTTLVVAESLGLRLTAFDIAADGTLHGQRVWADLRPQSIVPDGTCVDADGGIWVATALQNRAYRVTEGGTVTDAVETSQPCFAVALSGADRRTLVCCTAPSSMPGEVAVERLGRLEAVQVAVPGTG
ncbi:SMP-30/gluconolactonase/LRE family protein [Gandjariella thermophila]|uniref:Gluconolaconase n=1 Tax=Gandjariella thermophila TaxID=1931992 RepID=A0A4D4J6G6_9PSEU|nr:SMP-30/gluconolactonase/LRE family protein [Gandjariella thermophila]GDY30318.1 gluconolaconase [Gandjariella thermophila]